MGRRSGLVWKLGGALLVLAVLAGVFLQQSKQARQRQEELMQLVQQTEQGPHEKPTASEIKLKKNTAEPSEELAVRVSHVLSGTLEADILVTPEQFAGKAALSSGYSRGIYASALLDDLNAEVQPEDILVLEFQACSNNGLAELDVYIGQTQNHIFVGKTPASYYIPVSGLERVEEVAFAVTNKGATVTLDRLYLTNYGDRYPIEYIKAGVFSENSVEPEEIKSTSLTEEASNQSLVDGEYLYSINNGSLHVYRLLEDGKTEKVATLGGMAITRDMAFNSDRTALVITSRHNGAYLIDISDPENPVKSGHYDTLEATTGVSVAGNYAFLCDGYSGVEIVDISDIRRPGWVNTLSNNAEYQDCFVADSYLYVGAYDNRRIDIYDIEDLGAPNLLSQINLDGAGQGCYVKDGILYAATALNSSNASNSKSCFGAGTGNGLEIYSISNPKKPERLSVTKLDGRYNASGCSFRDTNNDQICDVWDVQVSGRYAYMSSMFQGLYIYDVSAPEAPVLVKHIQLNIPLDSAGYATFGDDKLLNWDWTESGRGCMFHVTLTDQKIYATIKNMGVYALEWENAVPIETVNLTGTLITIQEEKTAIKNATVQKYKSNGSVWSAIADEKYIYAACGDAGLVLLDQNMNEVDVYHTETAVRDVKKSGKYLYTAESGGGIGVYNIVDKKLERVAILPTSNELLFASQLQIFDEGKCLLVQMSNSNHSAVDISNPEKPQWSNTKLPRVGTMYYRNIASGTTEQGWISVIGRKQISWYSAENGTVNLENSMENQFFRKDGGITAIGKYSLVVTNNGIVAIDPETGEFTPTMHFGSMRISGKPSYGDGLLVISDTPNGLVTMIDFSNLENPVPMGQFKLSSNPDIAFIRGNTILLPCRRGGLLKITRNVD